MRGANSDVGRVGGVVLRRGQMGQDKARLLESGRYLACQQKHCLSTEDAVAFARSVGNPSCRWQLVRLS